MAITFPDPGPLPFNGTKERKALDKHFTARNVPKSRDGHLLVASWNIANLGPQDRPLRSLYVIAHILKRFDLVAVQELNDDFGHFQTILKRLGPKYNFVMSDKAGNDERLAFIYRVDKVELDKVWGEVALTKREYPKRTVTVHYRQGGEDKTQKFSNHRFIPFDRNPYIGSFISGRVEFIIANVHLYYGAAQNSTSEKNRLKYARRVLEIHALARWAHRVSTGEHAWDRDILLMGDMNVPNTTHNEATIKALREFGWRSLDYESNDNIGNQPAALSRIGGSNIGNDKTYDQMAVSPSRFSNRITGSGVFDFDNVVFATKWNQIRAATTHSKAIKEFRKYLRFHLSDHRPLWLELKTD